MKYMKLYLLIMLFITPLLLMNLPVKAEAASNEFIQDSEGTYRIRIEASQWEFKAFDMNLAEEKGISLNIGENAPDTAKQAKESLEVIKRIVLPEKGAKMVIEIYSRDVQHGFSINEMGIAVALNRPAPGKEFGKPIIIEATLPNEDVSYSAYCHIFCGLGHPDMKLKFVIGAGSVEYGLFVFWGAILLNIAIFGVNFKGVLEGVKVVNEKEE